MNENGIVIKNKARLVAQVYNQQEGINYEETFAPVARLEAIRIFLAYAAYMDFMVYQMDVKSAFLKKKISKEVYVQQPPGFESSEFPNHVYMLDKALYRLKQAPRACASVKCPMLPPNNLGPDESGVSINETMFIGMIGSLMYLTTSRLDILFSTCLCARNQANPKESHLVAVKRIFRYLKGTPHLGLWYPKGSGFDLKAYSNSDYAGCNLDRKSTPGGCQILRGKLVCWSVKKQSSVAMSSAEAEYVAAAGCCAQVLWIKSQLVDYDVLYDKVPICCDNTSAIAISNNPVLHSRTKHIDIRYHFIIDHILKGDIELHFVPTDLQLADIFTKPLAEPSFTRLVAELDEFISAIGLLICKDVVPLPPKETVRAGLATLGLFDKDKPTLSSTVLVNSSPLKIKGLEIDIGAIIFSDLVHKLQNMKKNRESNICYTRFLSPIFEKLLGDKYINNNLTLVKPHTISAASFHKPLASEVPLTSHMLKVAKLYEEPKQCLIPPSGEVNADDTADKSLSRAFVQPVTQPKAPTDLKTKRKRIPPSSKPESQYKVRVISPKKLVAETQHAEVIVATADAESSEDQGNQPSVADAEKRSKSSSPFRDHKSVTDDIDITPKDDEGDDSNSGLRSMPDDDLASLTGFETQDSSDHFYDAASIAEELPQVEAQVQKNLQDQLPNILLKPMYKEFNAFNKLESGIFDNLQEQLNKGIKTSLDKSMSLNVQKGMKEVQDKLSFCTSTVDTNSQHVQDLNPMFKDMFSFLEAAEVFKKANTEGEKEQSSAQVIPNAEQAPPVHKEKALVLHTSEEKSSGEKNTNDEPPLKKLKFLIPTSSEIPSPTPLNSIMPELQKLDANKMTMDQFTEHLTNTTSSIFSPSPLREPTPPIDEHKGKGIATEDPIKDIMPFLEEGGSAPKIPIFKSFVIPEGQLTLEDIMAQLKEMKRLVDLKVEKEKSKKSLKKILNPATIRA
ncbi:retrovirus-related pol polyprotein from transposon TNT 1-94 [Tanacetum coccineum]